mmetsp:Transcript_10607/g.13432  ORF Transcript_10607/g.13432 Transcript_10607/m.13432 type:complete len:152 (+) Transcript_10607:144-599(+)
MFYLSKKDWSPRYESTFFTVSLDCRKVYTSPPLSNNNSDDTSFTEGGKNSFPAIYFLIKVKCGYAEHVCPRRYSQFELLYHDICDNPPTNTSVDQVRCIRMPPKTCVFQSIDDDFLDVRQQELYDFLESILVLPGCADHPNVKNFLCLDKF